MKKLTSVLLALIMTAMVCCNVSYAAEGETAFTGRREATYALDNSYLSNYFNGGRAAFDRYLRAAKPEWLGINYRTEGQRIYMTLSFPFDSLEDYREKIIVLTQTEPTVFYTAGEPVRFVENVSSMQLLNFCRAEIEADAVLEMYTFDELVTFLGGLFVLNGIEYSAAEWLSINNDPLPYAASMINITTTLDESYQYTRVIQLAVSTKDVAASAHAQLREHLETWSDHVEVETVGETRTYSITFSVGSYSELEKYTMGILNATDSIHTEESYIDDETLGVAFSEVLDLSQILDSSNGTYNYVFKFPAAYTVGTSEEERSRSNMVVIGGSNGNVSFQYTKPFSLEEIIIRTDISDLYGRVKRSVTCRVPVEVAPYYHEEITSFLKERLTNGQTLTIYDSTIYRNYEISYGSWFLQQIRAIGQAQLSESTFALNRAKIPYMNSQLAESWSGFDLPYSDATGNIRYEILLPEGTTVRVKSSTGGTVMDGGYFIENLQCGEEIVLVFKDASRHAMIVCALLLCAVLIVVLVLYLTVKKWIKKVRGWTKEKKNKTPDVGTTENKPGTLPAEPQTCSQCGAKLKEGARFCVSCGRKIADT